MAEEREFLNEGNVRVTNSRFIVGGQTYAISTVNSVRTGVRPPPRAAGILLLGLGIAVMIVAFYGKGELTAPAPGVLIVALALVAASIPLLAAKPTYLVMLTTSSGETKALESKDGPYIARAIAALNDAIVHRG